MRRRTLDAFVNAMVDTCACQKRVPAALGDFSNSSKKPTKGHVHALAGLTIA